MISQDGLSVQSKDNRWQGVRANKGVCSKGGSGNKFYYEVHFSEPGLARVGWSLQDGSLDLGTDQSSWGFGGTGKKSNSKNFQDYGTTFGDRGDIIGNMIDLDNGTISWSKNGQLLGVAYQLNFQIYSQTFFPSICTKNAMVTTKFSNEKGDSKFPVPKGFTWISEFIGTNKMVDNAHLNSNDAKKLKKELVGPQAIIIEPSRELAEQTLQCLVKFKNYLEGDIKLLLVVGGVNIREQIAQLEAGVDIIVATPGRLEELLNNNYIKLHRCQ